VETVALVVLDAALVLAVSSALRRVLGRLRQPPVMADILAGIVLGATVLGTLPGDPSRALFTAEARAVLSALGEVALVAYLFAAAARFDTTAFRRERRAVGTVAVGSFAVPWLAGAGLALGLHGSVAADPPRVPFVLFLGTALAVTAVPVLARIVDERGMEQRPAARIALAAAGAQELLVWPALAVTLAVGGGGSARAPALVLVAGVVAVLAVVGLARATGAALAHVPRRTCGVGALVALGLAAAATDLAGLHLVIGALLFGVALPARARDAALAVLELRPLRVARAVCLPLFFALPALRVDVWALGAGGLWLLVAVLGVAAAAKLGSATFAARWAGASRADALTVGALMNARGLVELVVVVLGLEAGLIDDRLFTVTVLMALLTTLATGPLVDRIDRRHRIPRPALAVGA
jgi:Kef-type K+ transport system membrane component KefB